MDFQSDALYCNVTIQSLRVTLKLSHLNTSAHESTAQITSRSDIKVKWVGEADLIRLTSLLHFLRGQLPAQFWQNSAAAQSLGGESMLVQFHVGF